MFPKSGCSLFLAYHLGGILSFLIANNDKEFMIFLKKVYALSNEHSKIPNDWDRSGLPAWSFFNKEMFEAEKDLFFRRHWQLICHSNDIPNNGDFVTWDLIGASVHWLSGALTEL